MRRRLKVLTASEMARRVGVHPKTISRLMRQGKVTGVKVANRWLIEEAAFETFAKTYAGKKGRPEGWRPGKEAVK